MMFILLPPSAIPGTNFNEIPIQTPATTSVKTSTKAPENAPVVLPANRNSSVSDQSPSEMMYILLPPTTIPGTNLSGIPVGTPGTTTVNTPAKAPGNPQVVLPANIASSVSAQQSSEMYMLLPPSAIPGTNLSEIPVLAPATIASAESPGNTQILLRTNRASLASNQSPSEMMHILLKPPAIPGTNSSEIPVETPAKATDCTMYTRLFDILDEDIKDLEQQLSLLESEVVQCSDAVDRSCRRLQNKASRRNKASNIHAALRSCQQHLTKEAFEFLYRQQVPYSKPQWDVCASKLPILFRKCGVRVRSVLEMLFKLPGTQAIMKYKAQARQDPTIYNNSTLMNEFVQKQYKCRFKRIQKGPVGRRKSVTSSSVSYFLKDFLEKNS